jgi:hypothetical protein
MLNLVMHKSPEAADIPGNSTIPRDRSPMRAANVPALPERARTGRSQADRRVCRTWIEGSFLPAFCAVHH